MKMANVTPRSQSQPYCHSSNSSKKQGNILIRKLSKKLPPRCQTLAKIATAFGKAKDKVSETAREAEEKVSEIAHGAKEKLATPKKWMSHEAKDKVARTAYQTKKAVEQAEKVRQKAMAEARKENKVKTSANKFFDGLKYMTLMEVLNSVMGMANLLGLVTAYGMNVWVTFISSSILGKGKYCSQVMFEKMKLEKEKSSGRDHDFVAKGSRATKPPPSVIEPTATKTRRLSFQQHPPVQNRKWLSQEWLG
ncbi:Uncharacterized protein TCM_036472 [Theobroma cacao]|uniref:Uncharacterized protein n=1 Tax=Theobroma cacao TaxID=3641 RepID=A0A061FJQ9_THECC|nr:Uncharacterized protein TCM_036472 [Theobroma cacao]